MTIDFPKAARLIRRVWRPELEGPSVVVVRVLSQTFWVVCNPVDHGIDQC